MPVFIQYRSAINIAVAAVASLTAMQVIFRGKIRGVPVPSELTAVALLLTLAGVSFFWSVSPTDTTQQLTKCAPYLITFVFLTPLCVNEQLAVTTALDLTIKFGGLILAGLLFSNLGIRGVVLDLYVDGRLNEGNPLEIASYACTVSLCAIISAFTRERRLLSQLFLTLVAALGIYITIRSQSRGQLLAMLATLVLWLPIITGVASTKSKFFSLGLIAVFSILAIYVIQELSLLNRWSGDQLANAGTSRFGPIRDVLTAYADSDALHWIVGLGSSASFQVTGCYPHCVPLEILAEEGVIGLILFSYFSIAVFRSGYRVLTSASIHKTARFNIGTLLALFTFHGLLTLKQGNFLGSAFFLSFGVTVAWVIPRYSCKTKKIPSTAQRTTVRRHALS